MNKEDRLMKFLTRLDTAPSAQSGIDAFQLVIDTLEDEFSGVPFQPSQWMDEL